MVAEGTHGDFIAPGRSAKKRGPLLIVAVAVVAVLLLVVGAVAVIGRKSSPSLASMAPNKILSLTLAAARKAGSAHAEAKYALGGMTGSSSIEMSGTGGSETDSVDGHVASIVAVNDTLYFQADAGYLSQQLGVPVAFASRYADEWLAMPASASPDLQQADDQLHAPVVIDNLLSLSDPIAKLAAPGPGEVAITGKVPQNTYTDGSGAGDLATLIVSSKAPYLPISLSYSDPDNGSTTLTFSAWGEYVALSPPAGAVPVPPGALSAPTTVN